MMYGAYSTSRRSAVARIFYRVLWFSVASFVVCYLYMYVDSILYFILCFLNFFSNFLLVLNLMCLRVVFLSFMVIDFDKLMKWHLFFSVKHSRMVPILLLLEYMSS